MNFLSFKGNLEKIDPDGKRVLDHWVGIKGIPKKRIKSISDKPDYYEFEIDTEDPKFKQLMVNKRAMEGHFNSSLKIIYVYPQYLSSKELNKKSEIIRPPSPSLKRLPTMSSPPKYPSELLPGERSQKRRKLEPTKLNFSGGFHLFKRLGVTRRANTKQIKKAYEKMKKKRKGKLSKKVKLAYKILSNPKSRKKYINSYKHKKTKKRRKRNQRGCSRRRK